MSERDIDHWKVRAETAEIEAARLKEENTRIQARQVAEVADRIDSRSNAMVVDLTEKLVAAEGTITRLQSELRYLDRRFIDRGDQLVMLRMELKAARKSDGAS
jgi:hypothetical protein